MRLINEAVKCFCSTLCLDVAQLLLSQRLFCCCLFFPDKFSNRFSLFTVEINPELCPFYPLK